MTSPSQVIILMLLTVSQIPSPLTCSFTTHTYVSVPAGSLSEGGDKRMGGSDYHACSVQFNLEVVMCV